LATITAMLLPLQLHKSHAELIYLSVILKVIELLLFSSRHQKKLRLQTNHSGHLHMLYQMLLLMTLQQHLIM
jgi:hypothetical protein